MRQLLGKPRGGPAIPRSSEQQATTGLLTVDDPSQEASARRFDLPQDLWPVLVDQLSPMYLRPLGRVAVSALRQAPALLDAYRRGGGVPWSAYGEDMRTGQAEFNGSRDNNIVALPASMAVPSRMISSEPADIIVFRVGTGTPVLNVNGPA